MSYSELSPSTRSVAEGILTQKQLDVLRIWMSGYSTHDIARIVGVAEPVARAHLGRALQKLAPHMEEMTRAAHTP